MSLFDDAAKFVADEDRLALVRLHSRLMEKRNEIVEGQKRELADINAQMDEIRQDINFADISHARRLFWERRCGRYFPQNDPVEHPRTRYRGLGYL